MRLDADVTRVSRFGVPDLGVGVGYRVPHYAEVLRRRPAIDWFEVISENFMVDGGSPRWHLERLAELYPVVPHGVSLSLGSEPDPEHLGRLRALLDRLDPPWWSDHLCFTGAHGRRVHDLLPLPYDQATLEHVSDRIKGVQDQTGRLFAVENVSSYLSYRDSDRTEWAFLAELVERADCAILLDVNNVYVSACNHGYDPIDYLDAVPTDRVVQIHLAGHTLKDEGYRLDTHDREVCDEVWALYRRVIARLGPVSTLIEWDEDIPTLDRLGEEADRARAARQEAQRGHASA